MQIEAQQNNPQLNSQQLDCIILMQLIQKAHLTKTTIQKIMDQQKYKQKIHYSIITQNQYLIAFRKKKRSQLYIVIKQSLTMEINQNLFELITKLQCVVKKFKSVKIVDQLLNILNNFITKHKIETFKKIIVCGYLIGANLAEKITHILRSRYPNVHNISYCGFSPFKSISQKGTHQIIGTFFSKEINQNKHFRRRIQNVLEQKCRKKSYAYEFNNQLFLNQWKIYEKLKNKQIAQNINLDLFDKIDFAGLRISNQQFQLLTNQSEYHKHKIQSIVFLQLLYAYYSCKKYQPQIFFSLETIDVTTNSSTKVKTVWPDFVQQEKILIGTRVQQIMYEADWLMKQITMGIDADRDPTKIVQRKFSEQLIKKGFKSSLDKLNTPGMQIQTNFWFYVKEVEYCKRQRNGDIQLEIKVKMGVQSRQMEIRNNKLQPKKLSESNRLCTQIGQFMTQNFDILCKDYPIFKQLQNVAKAKLLAQWLWKFNFPINISKIKEIINKNRNKNYKAFIQNLNFKKQIIINDELFIYSIFGGVKLNVGNLNFFTIRKTIFNQEQETYERLKEIKRQKLYKKLKSNNFSGFIKINCLQCKKHIQFQSILKNSNATNHLCQKHDPHLCIACKNPIIKRYKIINNNTYHYHCANCMVCGLPLISEYEIFKNYENILIHPECSKMMGIHQDQLYKLIKSWESISVNFNKRLN